MLTAEFLCSNFNTLRVKMSQEEIRAMPEALGFASR